MTDLCQLLVQLQFREWVFMFVIFAVSAGLLRTAASRLRARHRDRPPGPPGLPIVGHLHLLGQLPHRSLCELSKKYGELMGIRLGSVPVVVASSSQMAKEILQTQDVHLAYRPQTAAAVHICFDGNDVSFLPLGPRWKLVRMLYATELFGPKKMESFRPVREGQIRELAQAVRRQSGGPVEVRRCLSTASNNISCIMGMGKKLSDVSGAGEVQNLAGLVEDVLHLCGVFYIGDYIPWLAWLDPNSYLKRMKDTAKRVEAVLQPVIDDRRQRRQRQLQEMHWDDHHHQEQPPSPQDLLDLLFAATSNNSTGDEVVMTDKHMMAALLDLFIGGSDTAVTAVEWALAELISHPQAMRKVHEELDLVVGKERLVQESDIPRLPYLGCVIKESMRLHPVAPFLIPRQSAKECVIGGFTVEAGTVVYVNTWAIGRDGGAWPRPSEFIPERFEDSTVSLTGQRFDFIPFGQGRRRCPGMALGVANLHLMLATLAQGFDWHYQGTLDMSEKFGLTLNMATSLRAVPTPRLPLHLFQ